MKVVRPAAPATGTPCCRLRPGLNVASSTPAALACRTPCLPAAGCAGPGCKPYP